MSFRSAHPNRPTHRAMRPPSRPSRTKVRMNDGVKDRWHDDRTTFIREFAESGEGDRAITDIAAKPRSRSSSITVAFVWKRSALEAIGYQSSDANESQGEYPQKSPQSDIFEGHRGVGRGRKSLKRIGSSGRTRTYNPSVNSRMLCH